MIEFTIKTLDSNNHNFQVENGITVQQLKEKVRDQMGIDINLQRLIFCGRVLQDEKKLSEYDVNGKVVHLVQRAPPSPESRHTNSTNTSGNNAEGSSANPPQPRRIGYANILREEQVSLSPTTGRLDFIRLMVSEIRTSLASLQTPAEGEDNSAAPASGEANVENMETDPTPSATQEEVNSLNDATLDENSEAAPDSAIRAHSARRSYRAIRALRTRHSRPRDLGQLMEELEALQEQFAPHRANYTRMLMAANNAETPVYTEEERQTAQRTVDIVSDIMHSFAHAYHAVSDINFQVGQRNPRLTSEASIMRHPLPMQQAHINVVQSNRRPNAAGQAAAPGVGTTPAPQATATATSVTATNTTATSAPGSAPRTTASATAPAATGDAQESPMPQAGRNTTQPTFNINIQPDPVTYQVEIETRVPIAFALENALLNGLSGVAVPGAPTEGQAPPAPPAPPSQPPAGAAQTAQQGQANRRQVLFDFENLFRGLGQTGGLGGVEVVMSMEEIPNGGIVGQVHPSAAAGPVGGQTPPTLQQIGMQHTDGGGNAPYSFGADIILGPMPWGGAPSADMLQNIVSSVIRQGLLPGGESVALQVAHALPHPSAALHSNPDQQPAAGAGASAGAGATQTPGRHGNLHLRRATTAARAHAVALNNFIYDRFLLCVSPHARRRLLRRREQHQNQAAASARARSDRAAAQNIETLRERNSNFTQSHMQTMNELFTSVPTRAAFTNAFFVAVARHLFLTEPNQSASGEPGLVPSEFQQLRLQLRTYLQDLLVRSGGIHSENTFDTVANFLLEEQESFLRRVESITPMRPDFNFLASMRALISSRLPAIVASVMSDSATEAFVARFYAVLSHLFTDMCTLIAYCCRDGVEGLRTLFRAFLEEKVRDFGGEDIQQLLLTLGMENLTIVINSLNAITHVDPIQQFVVRRAPAQSQAARQPSPMDVSPAGQESSAEDAPPALTPNVPAPPAAATSPSDITSTTSDTDHAGASRPASGTETRQASEPQPSRSAPSQSARPARPERETVPTRNSPDSQTNLGFVPPMMLLQHWGEEWVPVFTRDQHAQAGPPPEPYSDAYLSGMPSRKRRCVRQARPPNTLDSFMNESVREASERPAAVDSSAVRLAFREHMRNMARTRASSSADFDPLRYTSAARFLNATDAKKEPPKQTEDNA
ncbi:uncharacterized protein isoform X3 [Choristoneura fumiferana]|uniref:uncharacterized protein isoform X3 n=1 Tax=Choristoneura fumiferana TaxID=7141 RepID=UPI003D15DB4F